MHYSTMHRLRTTSIFARLACLLTVALLASMMVTPAPQAHAAGALIVNSVNDDTNDDGACTLREAMQVAFGFALNDDCGSGSAPFTMTFATPGPIKLSKGVLPTVNANLVMTGPVAIDGGGDKIFVVNSDGMLTLTNMSLTNGKPAVAVNGGTLNVAGVAFSSNSNDNTGGAIDSTGKVNIVGSAFTGNTSVNGSGGAINMTGAETLSIAGTAFNGNSAKLSGGAIYAITNVVLTDVVFNGNVANGNDGDDDIADEGGGAVFIAGGSDKALTVTRGVFNGNLSPKGSGGALFVNSDTTATIVDSSLNGNLAGTPLVAERLGGAIASIGGKVGITRSVLLNNGASGDGGAIANDRQAILTLANTSFTANAATGKGGAVSNNNTQQGSSVRPQVSARNSTFSLNAAKDQGGGMFNQGGATFSAGNTIFDGSDSAGQNCAGQVSSQGHNLDSGTSCGLTQAGDLSSADPKLDVPFFNGGPLSSLLTQKLKPGSAAIDAGDPAICAADPVNNQDIRGKTRPNDGNGDGSAICDIGAFESPTAAPGYGSTPVQPGPIAVGSAVANSGSVSASFSVFNTGDAPLKVNTPALGGANPGDFAVDPNLTLALAPVSQPQQIDVTCAPKALGTRTATLTFQTNDAKNANVTYMLVCVGTAAPAPAFTSMPAMPGPVDAGKVILGVPSGFTVITIKNAGNAPLTVNSLVLGGLNPNDFTVPANFAVTLNGGASQDLPFACAPQGLGIRTATLTLTTNDPNAQTVSFNLTCTGVLPASPVFVPGTSASVPSNSAHPYGVAVSPDGRNVYVRNLGGAGIRVYDRNPTTGDLSNAAFVANDNLAGDGLIIVSPDGKNVYATGVSAPANSGKRPGAVVAFARDTATGALSLLSTLKEGTGYGCFPGPCAGFITGLAGAYGLALSPDGQFLYVTGVTGNAVVVLRRNSDNGGLNGIIGGANFVQEIVSSANLMYAYGLAISPDGSSLYVANYTGNSVALFSRNGSDGKLAFVEKQVQGQNGVDGLTGVFRVIVSQDGANVYTAAYDQSSVAAFQRNPMNGKLSFLAAYIDNKNGVDGLHVATSLVLSPNGQRLYATGFADAAVAIFDRDTTSGMLMPNQVITRQPASGPNPNPALAGARDIAASADGRTLYVSAYDDDAVATLKLANPRPFVEALRPSSATAGSPAFTLNVIGANFMPDSQVQWNGSSRPTTFVNSTLLKAEISAADLATGGPFPLLIPVSVLNAAPGGGPSNTVPFTITGPNQNPVPSIERINPLGAAAGDAAFVLLVSGSNFMPDSQVQWNGSPRPTTFVSASTLKANISAADIAQPGIAGVTVLNAGPGGGVSNAKPFTISGPGENPAPSITQLDPASTIAAGASAAALTLTVTGKNFTIDSVARWNGQDRPTVFVSSTELRVIISASDVAEPGTAAVSVYTPAPGGGASNTASFTIGRPGDNPIPSLASYAISPVTAEGWTATLMGNGFVAGAKVLWNGTELSATVLSNTQIAVTLPVAEFGRAATIVIVNPGPGGGESNDLLLAFNSVFMPLARK